MRFAPGGRRCRETSPVRFEGPVTALTARWHDVAKRQGQHLFKVVGRVGGAGIGGQPSWRPS